jgi:hypothetical protein
MIRAWAVYDVFLGNPVLVERCATKDRALRIAELQRLPCGAARFVVEQLLPDGPLILADCSPGDTDQPTTG